jgi:hypothetical protein
MCDDNTLWQRLKAIKIAQFAVQFEFHGAGHNVALGALPPVHQQHLDDASGAIVCLEQMELFLTQQGGFSVQESSHVKHDPHHPPLVDLAPPVISLLCWCSRLCIPDVCPAR